jgi:hypothetical protein
MFRSPLRRLFAVLVVSLALTTPLCEAASRGSAPGRARQTAPASSHVFGLWDWLTSLWVTDGGCGLDPGGLCSKNQSTTDGGCTIDPSGRCAQSQNATDGGCTLDPNGNTICRGHS